VLEVIIAVAAAIGKDKSSIRESSYGVAGSMLHYPEMVATYDYLPKELDKLDNADMHLPILNCL
jgi:N-ethylmaleimide reductase